MSINEVPLLDLNAQYEPIKKEVSNAFEKVFESKKFINGPQVAELENEIAKYCNTDFAVGVSSGTDALIIALMAYDIGYGDEVITTPFTFFATAGSIARLGAKPVFVDIDERTYNIDPVKIEEAITKKTKAIIPVHIFGQMADMDPIMNIAKKYGLAVIEDAAQAIGAEYKGKKAGSIGDIGCFSFFPSKNLGCCGDGGIVTLGNSKLYEKIKVLKEHGSKPKYYHKIIGGNFRLDTIQAAILLVKLQYIEEQHKGRIYNAKYYNERLSTVINTPFCEKYNKMIYNQYTIRTDKRDELQKYLNDKKIGNAIYYPIPLHLQECFSELNYKKGDLPIVEKVSKEVLSIPIYAELSDEQKDFVIENIKKFFI